MTDIHSHILFGVDDGSDSVEDNLKRYSYLKNIVKDNDIGIDIFLGNEIYINEHIIELLDNNIISSLNGTQYVLIEFSLYNKILNLKRVKIITPDGCANYIRDVLNKMDENTFNEFIKYHLSTCERYEMIGSAAHTLDILKKED